MQLSHSKRNEVYFSQSFVIALGNNRSGVSGSRSVIKMQIINFMKKCQ